MVLSTWRGDGVQVEHNHRTGGDAVGGGDGYGYGGGRTSTVEVVLGWC